MTSRTKSKSQSPPRLQAVAPPPAPSRWPTIPQVAPSNPAFLTYVMLSSYKAEANPEKKSLIAAMLPAYRNDLIYAAIAIICTELSPQNPGHGPIQYALAKLK